MDSESLETRQRHSIEFPRLTRFDINQFRPRVSGEGKEYLKIRSLEDQQKIH